MAEERDEGNAPQSEPPRGRARSRDDPQSEPPRPIADERSAAADKTESGSEVSSGNNPKPSPPRPFSPAPSSNTHDDTFDSSVFDSPHPAAPFDDSVSHSAAGSVPSSPIEAATPETKKPRPLSWANVAEIAPEKSSVKSVVSPMRSLSARNLSRGRGGTSSSALTRSSSITWEGPKGSSSRESSTTPTRSLSGTRGSGSRERGRRRFTTDRGSSLAASQDPPQSTPGDAQRDDATERQTLARLRGRLKSLAEEYNLLDLFGTLSGDGDAEDSSDEKTIDSLLSDTFAKLATEIGHRSESIAAVKAELEKFKKIQAAIQQEKQSIVKAVKEKDAQIAGVRQQLADVSEELEAAKEARDAYYDQLDEYNTKCEQAENKRAEVEDKLEQAESRQREITKERDRLDAQREHLQSRVQELERNLQAANVTGTEELEIKLSSLNSQLREEQTARAKEVKDFEQKERKFKSKEDGYCESLSHYEEVIAAAAEEKKQLSNDIDRLKQELDECRRKRAAAKPESATFLVDGEKVSYKQYEKMLSNTRGEIYYLKQQLDQVQDEQRLSQEIPLEDVRRTVEPYLKVYSHAFENALLTVDSGSHEEEDSIDALVTDDGYEAYPRVSFAPDAERQLSRASTSSFIGARGDRAPDVGDDMSQISRRTSAALAGSHDLKSELQGLSLSRESSIGFEEPEVSQPPQSGMLSKPCSPTVVSDLRARLLQAMTKIQTLETQKQVYETQIQELRDKISFQEGKIQAHEAIAEQLKSEISRARDQQSSGAEQKKLAEHEATISSLSDKLQAFQENLSEANQHRDRLQQEIADTQTELMAWQASGDEVGNANLSLERELAEKENEIASAEGRIEELQTQLAESIARNEEIENERFELQRKLAEERYKRLAETERRTEAEHGAIWEGTAGKELRAHRERVEQLEKELFINENDLRAKNRKLKNQADDLFNVRADLAAYKKENELLNKSLAHANQQALQESEKQHSVQTIGTQTEMGQGEVVRVLGNYLRSLREFAEFEEKLANLLEEFAKENPPKPNEQPTDISQPSETNQPLAMNSWDERIGRLDQLEEMRGVLNDLRQKKEECWKSLMEAQNGELYMLDLELGTLEERLRAVEAGRGLPTDDSADLSLQMAIKQGEKDEILHPMTIESAVLRKDIKAYGARLTDLVRQADQPPPTPPLQAPTSILASGSADDSGEPQLPPGSASANRLDDGPLSSPSNSGDGNQNDKGDSVKVIPSTKAGDLSSRPYFVAEIDAIRIALERLDTSTNNSLRASRVVREIQLHADHSLQLHVDNNNLLLPSYDGDSEPPYDLSTDASDSGGNSVFDHPTQDPDEVKARLGLAVQEFNDQISQIPVANRNIIRAIHSLVRRAVSVQNHEFLRAQARKFALQRDQAIRILENKGAELPMLKEHEQQYREEIERLKAEIQELRAQLSDRDGDKEMVESLSTQLANLRAGHQTMPLQLEKAQEQLRQTEEKLEDVLHEKQLVVREQAFEILRVTQDLRNELEESQKEVDLLQKKLDLEHSSRSAPIDHLTDRQRELEQQLAAAERAQVAAEESHLHARLRLQQLLNRTGVNDGERMRCTISQILDPTVGSNADADTDSGGTSDAKDGTEGRFGLEQEVQELKKKLESRQGRDDQLQKNLDAREKLFEHMRKQFELSEDNRIAGVEKCTKLEKEIKELQAMNEELHVNFAALDDRPASRFSQRSGGDISDSPSFGKGSGNPKKKLQKGKGVLRLFNEGGVGGSQNEPDSGKNDTAANDKIIADLMKENEQLKRDAVTMLEVLEGSSSKSSEDVKKWKEKGANKKKKDKGKGKEIAKPRLKTASKDEDPEASSSSSSSDSDSSRKDDNNGGGGGPSQSPEDKIRQLREENRILKKTYFEAKKKADDMEKELDAMKAETPERKKPEKQSEDKPDQEPEDRPGQKNRRKNANRNNGKPKAQDTTGTAPPAKPASEFKLRLTPDGMNLLPDSSSEDEEDNKPPGDGNGKKGTRAATKEEKEVSWIAQVMKAIGNWFFYQICNFGTVVECIFRFEAVPPQTFAFLVISFFWLGGLFYFLFNWFALRVSRELWARGNDLTRAYYIEAAVEPWKHSFLSLGGTDSRSFPSISFFAGVFYDRILARTNRTMGGMPWEARSAAEEGIFPVYLNE